MAQLELVLEHFTEITVLNINGKLYVNKVVGAVGAPSEEYLECDSIHLALRPEDLANPLTLPAATENWSPLYENWMDTEI